MKEPSRTPQRRVLTVGPLPPPIHGASLIHEKVCELLEEHCQDLFHVDTSGGGGSGFSYHARRAWSFVRATMHLARARVHGWDLALYVTGSGGLGLWYQVGLIRLSANFGVPVVFHHHSFAYLNEDSRAMRRICSTSGVTHVLLCLGMKNQLQRRYAGAVRAVVCSNRAFLASPPVGRPRVSDGGIRLAHLSNLSPEKGLGVSLLALERLREAGQAVTLLIAGPAEDPATAALLETAMARAEGRITYYGRLAREQVPAFLDQADIFLFPSRYRNEAEPLVVLEALIAGVPVLTYRLGCLSDTFLGTDWAAAGEDEFVQTLTRLVSELTALSCDTDRKAFLRELAGQQLARFTEYDSSIILRSMGLCA